jgi:non-homologous end joining protein Ku
MRGTHSNLIVTQREDDATGELKPLFAFPVQICKAVESEEIRFDRAAPSGAKVQQVYRDTVTGEILESGDLIRGIRTGDSFQHIPEEQIKAIDEQLASKDIIVERTVNLDAVPFDRVTGSYYLQVPAKNGSAKHYRLLYEALNGRLKKDQPRALRVSFVSRTRQKLGVIYADTEAQCLVLVTLNYAAAVRGPDEQILSHLNAEVDKEVVDKARAVVDALDSDEAGDWDAPVDVTIARRRELVEAALAGEGIEAPVTPEAADANEEVESMLEASLAAV